MHVHTHTLSEHEKNDQVKMWGKKLNASTEYFLFHGVSPKNYRKSNADHQKSILHCFCPEKPQRCACVYSVQHFQSYVIFLQLGKKNSETFDIFMCCGSLKHFEGCDKGKLSFPATPQNLTWSFTAITKQDALSVVPYINHCRPLESTKSSQEVCFVDSDYGTCQHLSFTTLAFEVVQSHLILDCPEKCQRAPDSVCSGTRADPREDLGDSLRATTAAQLFLCHLI